MPFNWNNFSYTNFHELNLDWFSEHFKEIFEEWEELYNTLTQWKDDTDTDLAQWKLDTLANMDTWENNLLDALDTWKRETGEDIDEWETDVIGDLNGWKQDFLDAYDVMYNRVDAIVSDTEDMIENLAEPFSTSQAYSAGDYVIYNGVLYVFTADHAAGVWTGTDASQTTAMNDVTDLNTAINTQETNIKNLADTAYVDKSLFEFGKITISDTGWVYSDSTTEVRTKEGITIHLKPGDSFGQDGGTENIRMLVGWRKADDAYGSYGSFIYDRFTAMEEGDYVFSIQITGGASYTVESLMSMFYIRAIVNSEIDNQRNVVRLNQIGENGKDKLPAHFFRGTYSSATAFSTTSTTARKRIMSLDYLRYDRAVTLRTGDGYRFMAFTYTAEGASDGSIAWTNSAIIPAGKMFRICIAKSVEETVDPYDFSDYADSVSVSTFTSESVTELYDSIGSSNIVDLKIGYIRAGSSDPSMDGRWVSGSGNTMANPIIAHYDFPVRISTDWSKYNAYLYYYASLDESTFISPRSSKLTSDVDIPANTYFRCLILRSDSAVLSEFDKIDIVDKFTVYGLSGTQARTTVRDLQAGFQNLSRYNPIAAVPFVAAEIDRVSAEIKAKYGLGDIGVFGFNTDQHLRDNVLDATKNSREYVIRGLHAMSVLTQRHPFDFVCLGGDAAGYYTTTIPGIVNDIIEVNAALHGAACPVLSITGNHDGYENNNSMTNGDLYFAHVKKAEKIANITMDDVHTNYVLDSKGNKIRYIFLDDTPRDGYSLTDCADYLDASLQGTPTGYSIVIISHHALSSALDSEIFTNALGLQSHLVSYRDRIICCVNGHSHRDGSATSAGILYIETTTAGMDSVYDSHTRIPNSPTETAQDVYVIDKNAKRIYTIRYGAGNNREFDYDNTSGTFGEIV